MICPHCQARVEPKGSSPGEPFACGSCGKLISNSESDATLDSDPSTSAKAGEGRPGNASGSGKRPVKIITAPKKGAAATPANPPPPDPPADREQEEHEEQDEEDRAGAEEWIGLSLLGRYEVIRFLAKGGMGQVFLGRDNNTQRYVAIKVLSEELQRDKKFLKRFELEAETLKEFEHTNIVDLYARGKDDQGRHFLVMPYVQGPPEAVDNPDENPRKSASLADAAAARSAEDGVGMEFEPLRKIICGVLEALEYARQKRSDFVHRDIKLGNILVDESWKARLVDFGIARGAVDSKGEPTLTSPGAIVGTLAYMAPELLEDPSNASHQSDLYAVGVVLYRCLTNKSAGTNRDPVSQLRKDLNPEIDRIIEKALAPKPAHRYRTAAEMREALEDYQFDAVPKKPGPGGGVGRKPPGGGSGGGGGGGGGGTEPGGGDGPTIVSSGSKTTVYAVLAAVAIGVGFYFYKQPPAKNPDANAASFKQAIEQDDTPKALQLLQADRGLPSYVYKSASNQTALHLTAEFGRDQVTESLLKQGLPTGGIDARDAEQRSPLAHSIRPAVDSPRLRTVKMLLSAGADPDLLDGRQKSAFQSAIDQQLTNLVALLGGAKLRKDLDDLQKNPQNAAAIQVRMTNTMHQLQLAGVSGDYILNQTTDPGQGTITDAFSHSEQEQMVKTLFGMSLTNWDAVYFATNRNGLTAVQQAVKNANFPVAKVFIENLKAKLPDPTAQNRVVNGLFPLVTGDGSSVTTLLLASLAHRVGQQALVPLLLDNGALGNITNAAGQFGLHIALANEAPERGIVDRLLGQAGASARDILAYSCNIKPLVARQAAARSGLDCAVMGGYSEAFVMSLLDRGLVVSSGTVAAALERTNLTLINNALLTQWRTNAWGDVQPILAARYTDPKDQSTGNALVCVAVKHDHAELLRTLITNFREDPNTDCGGLTVARRGAASSNPAVRQQFATTPGQPPPAIPAPGPTPVVVRTNPPSTGAPVAIVPPRPLPPGRKRLLLCAIGGNGIQPSQADYLRVELAEQLKRSCPDVEIEEFDPPTNLDLRRDDAGLVSLLNQRGAQSILFGELASHTSKPLSANLIRHDVEFDMRIFVLEGSGATARDRALMAEGLSVRPNKDPVRDVGKEALIKGFKAGKLLPKAGLPCSF